MQKASEAGKEGLLPDELNKVSAGEVSGFEYRQVNVWIAFVQGGFILETKLVFLSKLLGFLYLCPFVNANLQIFP